jgi:hypothetical protein
MTKKSICGIVLFSLVSLFVKSQSFGSQPFLWHYLGTRQVDYAVTVYGFRSEEGISKKAFLGLQNHKPESGNVVQLGLSQKNSFLFSGRGEIQYFQGEFYPSNYFSSMVASDLSFRQIGSLYLRKDSKHATDLFLKIEHLYNGNFIDKNNDHFSDQPLLNNYNIFLTAGRIIKNSHLRIRALALRNEEFTGSDTSARDHSFETSADRFKTKSVFSLYAFSADTYMPWRSWKLDAAVQEQIYKEETRFGSRLYHSDEKIFQSDLSLARKKEKLWITLESTFRNYQSKENLDTIILDTDRNALTATLKIQVKFLKSMNLIGGIKNTSFSNWGNYALPFAALLIKEGNPYGLRLQYSKEIHYTAPLLLAAPLLTSERAVTFKQSPVPDEFDKYSFHSHFKFGPVWIRAIYSYMDYKKRYRMDVLSEPGNIIFTSDGDPGTDQLLEMKIHYSINRFEWGVVGNVYRRMAQFGQELKQVPMVPQYSTGLNLTARLFQNNGAVSLDTYYSGDVLLPSLKAGETVTMKGFISSHLNMVVKMRIFNRINHFYFILFERMSLKFGVENLINTASIPGVNETPFSHTDLRNYYGARRFHLTFHFDLNRY